jgi:hypothetical protein
LVIRTDTDKDRDEQKADDCEGEREGSGERAIVLVYAGVGSSVEHKGVGGPNAINKILEMANGTSDGAAVSYCSAGTYLCRCIICLERA